MDEVEQNLREKKNREDCVEKGRCVTREPRRSRHIMWRRRRVRETTQRLSFMETLILMNTTPTVVFGVTRDQVFVDQSYFLFFCLTFFF